MLTRALLAGPRRGLRHWRSWFHTAHRLLPYLRRRRRKLALSLFLGVLYTGVGLAEPWTLKIVLDNVLLGEPLPRFLAPLLAPFAENRLHLLNALVAGIVLLAAIRGVLYYFQKILAARVGQEIVSDMRLDLYRHLQLLSFRFHDRRRTGDMIARLTSDIRYLRDIFVAMPLAMVEEVFLVVGMVGVMFLMDWTLTLIALAAIPVVMLVLRLYQGPMRRALRRQREREGDLASIASEVLGAIRVVQGFRREEHEVRRFSTQNKRSLRTGLKATRLEAKLRWYAEITVAAVTAVVIGVAARRVLSGSLSPGDLLVFVAYLRTFNRPMRRVSTMAERAARGAVAGERVLGMLELEPAIADRPGAIRAKRFRGEIVYEGVGMAYGKSAAVLDGVDLRIAPGERVAIVGPTGSGKSSLLALIPRFYEASHGRVLVDGHDVRDYTLASLREGISVVFQDPILFATTIAENIRYGKTEASDEEVVVTARELGIHDLIQALPAGYQTVVGERGGTLSGGQRQAIAIARALIKDAPIVLLDEPATGLDSEASSLVFDALERLMEGRTVLLVSHQLETVRRVDRVVVMERGRIVDQGTHEGLLGREGLYRTFHRLQAGGKP